MAVRLSICSHGTDTTLLGFKNLLEAGSTRCIGTSTPSQFQIESTSPYGLKKIECCNPHVTSPQSNGMAESFVKTLKRDYAKLANRPDSKTVMAQLKDWFDDYISYHPQSAIGYFRQACSGRNDR